MCSTTGLACSWGTSAESKLHCGREHIYVDAGVPHADSGCEAGSGNWHEYGAAVQVHIDMLHDTKAALLHEAAHSKCSSVSASAKIPAAHPLEAALGCRRKVYPPVPRYVLWIMMEIAIIGSDIQEVKALLIAE